VALVPLCSRRSSLAALVAAAALAVAGCGGEESSSGEAVATVDVSETDFALDPTDATVDESGVIEFAVTNDGETAHSLEIEADTEAVSDTIDAGQSTSFTAELDPGEYKWYCPIANHEDLGMVGTLTVGGGSASSGGSEPEDSGSSSGGSPSY
jgi:plastocyanin